MEVTTPPPDLEVSRLHLPHGTVSGWPRVSCLLCAESGWPAAMAYSIARPASRALTSPCRVFCSSQDSRTRRQFCHARCVERKINA